MLRNVLVDYLDTVSEREFDFPFLALLPALGFYDIHYTHGQVEFGKDFIAKRVENGVEMQYSFQSKAGDIGQSNWRNNVMAQMLESVLTGISHPNFDRELPHQAVLVTTGRLKGNTSLGLQDLNVKIEQQFEQRPVHVWDREKLADDLGNYGLEGVHGATASGFTSLGDFYTLYGKSLRGDVSGREIERHSRYWVDESLDRAKRLLRAAIESEIIASQCTEHGLFYDAIHAYLAALRVILNDMYRVEETAEIRHLISLYERAIERVQLICHTYHSQAEQRWQEADRDLIRIVEGPGPVFTYPVQCARILEVAGYLYFLTDDTGTQDQLASFIEAFVLKEPGCAHIPSDRYAVSLVLPVIVLCVTSRLDSARDTLRRATIWLCDRYEEGWGLAPLEANPYDEIATLLGYSLEFISEREWSGSLLASVVSDLSAFLGDGQFYGDVVNDIKASGIHPQYWQVPDTESLFFIEGPDIITYPHVGYADEMTDFEAYEFAEHIVHEPRVFQIEELAGPLGLMALMLLLRDRYFPTLWPRLAHHHD